MGFEDEMALVCETLINEIRHAKRWCTITKAREAIIHVRIMGNELIAEQKYINPDSDTKNCMANLE